MAEALRSNLCVPCTNTSVLGSSKHSPAFGFSLSPSSLRSQYPTSSVRTEFHAKPVVISENQTTPKARDSPQGFSLQAQSGLCMGKALKWWEKGLQPNMKEIDSAEDLVNSLLNAGNKLVILDFYSPGCGGCKALHPKIKKFKDALAKHTTEGCSLGPPRGLEESQLLALAANRELCFNYPMRPSTAPARVEETHKAFSHSSIVKKTSLEAAGARELISTRR